LRRALLRQNVPSLDRLRQAGSERSQWLRWPVVVVLLLLTSACLKQDDPSVEYSGQTMGTTYSVVIVDPPAGLNIEAAQAGTDTELARINDSMSNWNPESEISRFNDAISTDWVEVSQDTIALLRIARRISKETQGAYDVTLGSVSKLWGFHQASEGATEEIKPEMDEVLTLMYAVGYQLLQESRDGTSVRKLSPELQIDLSSIAKGFAVDRLGELLEGLGVTRYLVEIGGEIRTRGKAADGERWKIGIEWPIPGARDVPTGIAVENAHVATSGDYRNYREIEGVRYSHLLDGRSGYPVTHGMAQVTVLHGSVAQADAWATAFMVVGPDEALAIADAKGLAARFTVRDGASFKVITTPAFDAYSYQGD